MRFEALASPRTDGPFQRLDPRVTLIGTLAFVFIVVATPMGAWRLLAAEGLLLAFGIGLAGVVPSVFLRRWLALVVPVAFLALLLAFDHPQAARIGRAGVAGSVLTKNALSIGAVLVLGAVVPFQRLLVAIARLRAPAVLVATLHFMYRYLHVLGEELDRMVKARRSRSFRRSGRLDWGLLSGLIGVLILRALERGERVHAAMLARGWDGTLRSLDGPDA